MADQFHGAPALVSPIYTDNPFLSESSFDIDLIYHESQVIYSRDILPSINLLNLTAGTLEIADATLAGGFGAYMEINMAITGIHALEIRTEDSIQGSAETVPESVSSGAMLAGSIIIMGLFQVFLGKFAKGFGQRARIGPVARSTVFSFETVWPRTPLPFI